MNRLREFAGRRVSIGSKSVSVLTIMAVLFIGTGTASLVATFGTVSGDATFDNEALTTNMPTSSEFTYDSLSPPETIADSFTVSNNNADERVEYTVNATQSTSGDSSDMDNWNTTIMEVQEDTDSGDTVTVERDYDTATDDIVLNLTNYGGDSGAIYFDRDQDGTVEFQMGFYDTDAGEPRVQVWRNIDGTYEKDARFDPTDPDDEGEFDSDDDTSLSSGTKYVDDVSGYLASGYVTLRVDADELGHTFDYGVKDSSDKFSYDDGGSSGTDASDDSVSESASIGSTVVNIDTTDTEDEGTRTIYGTDTQGQEEFAIINEFGTNTPTTGSTSYTTDVKVAP